MILARDLAANTFVMLDADTPLKQARGILNGLVSATHLIVRRAGEQDAYYLLSRHKALNMLKQPIRRGGLDVALQLAQRKPARVIDAYADATTIPNYTIVVEGRRLLGFVLRRQPSRREEGLLPWLVPPREAYRQDTQESDPWSPQLKRALHDLLDGSEPQHLPQRERWLDQRPGITSEWAPKWQHILPRTPQISPERPERPIIRPWEEQRRELERLARERYSQGPLLGPRDDQRPGFRPSGPFVRPGAEYLRPWRPWSVTPEPLPALIVPRQRPAEGRMDRAGRKPSAAREPVTHSLGTTFPDRIRLGATRTLRVTLSTEAMTGGLRVQAKLGSRIIILVEPERGFELRGDGRAVLTVSAKKETAQFKLKATAPGPGLIWVYAYQGVQSLGRIPVAATVIAAGESLDAQPSQRSRLVPSVDVRQPDLLLEIHQLAGAAGPGIQMFLAAQDPALDLELRPFPAVPFHDDVEAFYRRIFADLEAMLLDTPEHCQDAQGMLEATGCNLFETLFPLELRTQLWAIKDRIKTVRIVSNEPWIPWELTKLEDEQHNPGPFLCEAYAVTRWIAGVDPQPALTLKKMAVVASEESGLEHTPAECAYLQSLAGGERQVERIPAKFTPLLQAFGRGVYDGWHYAGHGELSPGDPNESSIQLDDFQSLKPRFLSGCPLKLGDARPLVFLNACQAGRGAMSLTGMGGWAFMFLSNKAAAFIGSHWAIDDEVAFEFAKAFYDGLLKDKLTIGEAAKQARKVAREARPGDPTWLAYVVYADPMATVESSPA